MSNSTESQTVRRYRVHNLDIKFRLARRCQTTSISTVIRANPRLDLAYSTLAKWKTRYFRATERLGRAPLNAVEAGLSRPQREPLWGRLNDNRIRDMVFALRRGGAAINNITIASCITTVLSAHTPSLLLVNGGIINPNSRSLRSSFYRRQNLVRRAATSSRTQLSEQVKAERVSGFIRDVKSKVDQHQIVDQLVLNTDETSAKLVPVTSFTMAIRGSRIVRIALSEDKRAITTGLTVARSGDQLSPQCIYPGTTDRCHPPNGTYPDHYDITHTKSHWSTIVSKLRLFNNVILPYVQRVRQVMQLPVGMDWALWIFDYHASNVKNEEMFRLMTANRILWQLVPASCTDECQPLDQMPNRTFKRTINNLCIQYYTDRLREWIDAGNTVESFKFDSRLSVLKVPNAYWIQAAVESIDSDCIQSAFARCGIPPREWDVESD